VNTRDEKVRQKKDRNEEFLSKKKFGGAGGTRTPYLFNAIEALSRMSYSPILNLI
tara:strand:+ start:662 stop:826 length:165 start_codon:yes stop_codon:yes gene_type:complete